MSDEIKREIIEYLYTTQSYLVSINEIKKNVIHDKKEYAWETIKQNLQALVVGNYVLRLPVKKKVFSPRLGKYVLVNTGQFGFSINPNKLF